MCLSDENLFLKTSVTRSATNTYAPLTTNNLQRRLNMAHYSLNEPAWIINQNKINDILAKLEALLQVILNSALNDVPSYALHDYLWVLSDLVTSAKTLIIHQ